MKKAKNNDAFAVLYKKKDPFEGSQGFKKLWAYYLDLVKRRDFLDAVGRIREQCGVGEDKIDNTRLSRSLLWLALDYGLDGFLWEGSLADFVLKGIVSKPDGSTLCKVYDYLDADDPDDDTDEFDVIRRMTKNRTYPVRIGISPYATLRDIQDFISRHYTISIQIRQNIFRDKKITIGKSKNKKQVIQQRNDFIYQNRHFPRKQIMRLLVEQFGKDMAVDYGYIGKIISLEKKKRKEV